MCVFVFVSNDEDRKDDRDRDRKAKVRGECFFHVLLRVVAKNVSKLLANPSPLIAALSHTQTSTQTHIISLSSVPSVYLSL